MLQEIIRVLISSTKPVSLDGLSDQLNLDNSALEGMLQYLLQKGKIIEVQQNYAEAFEDKKSRIPCAGCNESNSCNFIDLHKRFFTLSEKIK